jgi:hypothetical protein
MDIRKVLIERMTRGRQHLNKHILTGLRSLGELPTLGECVRALPHIGQIVLSE